ncbi:MAG: hypothetical protein ABIA67_04725 [Candidatus Margulisiibacteriota bacterium]
MINGLGHSYPARQDCIDDGGVPLSDEYLEELSPDETLPIASPLLQSAVIPQWQNIINTCVAALATIEQDQEGYAAALAVLESLALNLFKEAFISEELSQSAIDSWGLFIQTFEQQPVSSGVVSALLILSHPRALPEDRALIFAFLTSSSENVSGALRSQIEQKIVANLRATSLDYNGWQSYEYISAPLVFLSALEGLFGIEGFERTLQQILVQRLPEVLTVINELEAQQLLDMPLIEFTQLLDSVMREAVQAPVGTQLKINVNRWLGDLINIALARGLSMQAYSFGRFMQDTMPELPEHILLGLYELNRAAGASDNPDNNLLRDRFFELYKELSEAFLSSDRGSQEHLDLAGAIQQLYGIGPRYGFSPLALDTMFDLIAARAGIFFGSNDQAPSLSQLDSSEQFVVGPAGLPPEVIQVLEDTGFYNLVAINLREIVLTPEINEGIGILSRDAGGRAYSGLHVVEIDYLTPEGEVLPAWMIAAILVHEASHVAWGRSVREELRQSTPDERQAFLNEARFLETYLGHRISQGAIVLNSSETAMIASQIVYDRLAGRGANRVLGYDQENYDPFVTELPSEEFLRSHGLSEVRDLDLNTYPTDLILPLAGERFDELFNSLDLEGGQRGWIRSTFEQILYDGAVFEGSLNDEQIRGARELRAGLAAIYRATGITEPLPSDPIMISSVDLLQLLTDLMIARDSEAYLRGLQNN